MTTLQYAFTLTSQLLIICICAALLLTGCNGEVKAILSLSVGSFFTTSALKATRKL